MVKKIIAIVIVFIIVIIGVKLLNKDDTIHIATIGYYTTTTTSASADAYRMVEYVINQLNDKGANYDVNRYDLKDYRDIQDLKMTLKNEKIDVVIGPNTSSEAEPIVEFLISLDIPVFMTTVASDVFTEKEDNIFRLTDTIFEQAKQISGVMSDKIESSPITIFYTEENKSFSKPLAEIVEEMYKEKDVESKLIQIGNVDDKSVQELLLRPINTKGALIIAGPGKAGIITDLISRNNTEVIFFHSSWSRSFATIDYVTEVDNEIYSLGYITPEYMDKYNEFTKEVLAAENLILNSFVYSGYETAYFVDYVLEEVGSLKLDEVQKFIHELDHYEGQFNEFEFNSTGDGGRGYSLLKVENNNYVIKVDALDY